MGMIRYGADYNPEQWSREVWREDLELMRESRASLMSLGIFSWARLEVTDGEFEFGWLDEVVDGLASAGVGIDLATATASPPSWLTQAHPEILPVMVDGTVLGHGSRQSYCPSSPVFRRYSARLASRLAQRYGTHPAVELWHVSNEYGCHVPHCYCEISAAAFRQWLISKYGEIDGLNQAWGTDFWSQRYGSFAEVNVPKATPTFKNPGQVADFMAFSSDELLACYLVEKAAIREYSQVPITTNFMGLYPVVNYRTWAQHVDIIADDSYPDPATPDAARESAFVSDLMRSLKDGQPFYLLEQATSAIQWRPENSRKLPGVFGLQSLSRIARGADAICQFQWRQSVRGAETFHSAMVPHSGRESRTFREVCQLGEVIERLAPVAGSTVQTPVALLMDWDSLFHRAAAIGPGADRGVEALRAWHETAFERGYPVDIVFPDSDLSDYRLIIVPELFAMSETTAQKLITAARAGAQIVVTAPTAVVDETGCAYQGGYTRILAELLGIRVIDHNLASTSTGQGALPVPVGTGGIGADAVDPQLDPRVNRITREVTLSGMATAQPLDCPAGSALFKVMDRICQPRPALFGGVWAEEIVVAQDCEVLASFTGIELSSSPAITYRALPGGGGGTYLATDLAAAGRAAVFQLLEARSKISSHRIEVPDGVEAVRRGEVLFLLNHGSKAAQLSGIQGYDLVSDLTVTGHLVLPPRSGAAVRLN